MKAYAKEIIKHGFILREEDIVKLNDICKKRIMETGCQVPLLYKIYRADSFLLETSDHLEVTKEENSERNLIQKLVIECKDSNIDFRLELDSKHGIAIALESDNRDFAYLLFSDLKVYITTEVAKLRSSDFNNIFSMRNLFPFIMIAFMVWTLTSIPKQTVSDKMIQSAKDASDLSTKINLLIDITTIKQRMPSIWKILVPLFSAIAVFASIGPILDKLYPRNIFCWGKASIKFDKIVSLREKLIWGVCIALFVGVISSYFVFWSTK